MASICAGCHQSFGGGGVSYSALGKKWHKHCLLCHKPSCGKSLLELPDFFEDSGFGYCEFHYCELHGLICAHCNEAITADRYVTQLGRNWHADHFVCCKCNVKLLGGTFYTDNEKPYCQSDYVEFVAPKCDVCHKGIMGKFIQTKGGQRYHLECQVKAPAVAASPAKPTATIPAAAAAPTKPANTSSAAAATAPKKPMSNVSGTAASSIPNAAVDSELDAIFADTFNNINISALPTVDSYLPPSSAAPKAATTTTPAPAASPASPASATAAAPEKKPPSGASHDSGAAEEIAALRAHIQQLEVRLASSEMQISAANGNVEGLEAKLVASRREYQEANDELKTLRASLNNSDNKQSDVQNMTLKLAAAENQIKTLTETVEKVKGELATEQAHSKQAASKHSEELKEKDKRHSELEAILVEQKKANFDLETKMNGVQKNLELAELKAHQTESSSKSVADTELRQKEKEIIELKSSLSERDRLVTKSREELAAIQSQLEQSKAEAARLQKSVDEQSKQASAADETTKSLKSKLEEKEIGLSKLSGDLMVAQSRSESLEKQQKSHEKEVADLKAEIHHLNNQLSQLKAQAQAPAKDVGAEKRIAELESLVDELNAKLVNASSMLQVASESSGFVPAPPPPPVLGGPPPPPPPMGGLHLESAPPRASGGMLAEIQAGKQLKSTPHPSKAPLDSPGTPSSPAPVNPMDAMMAQLRGNSLFKKAKVAVTVNKD